MRKFLSILMCSILLINICESSFVLSQENKDIRIFGGGLKKGIFYSPTYLCVEQQRIYVSDTYNNRIHAFIRGNVFQLSFGGFGQNQNQYDNVGGICSINDKIYIADSGNNRIQIVDTKGTYLGEFKANLKYPTDIATDGSSIYILDSGNQKVIKTDSKGNVLKQYAGFGSVALIGLDLIGNLLYITDSAGRINIFNTTIEDFVQEINVVKHPLGIKVVGENIYVCDKIDKCVYILNVKGEKIGKINNDQLVSPFDVSVFDNKITVSDISSHRVLLFDKNGIFYGFIGMEYVDSSCFVTPICLTKSEDSIMVLDKSLKVIQIFNAQGNLVRTCKMSASILNPTSIIYNNNQSFLLDKDSSKVFAYDQNGKKIYEWGTRGSDTADMLNPEDFAIFGNQIYITDSGNCRIQVFTLDGKYISGFSNPGQLFFAKSISVDSQNIYIADSVQNSIFFFNHNGDFITKIGKKGQEIGNFNGIGRIQIDDSDNLYVADTYNNRIQIINTRSHKAITYGSFGSIFEPSNIAKGEKDLDYSLNAGKFSYPTDLMRFQDSIAVVDRGNQRIQLIPFNKIFNNEIIHISTPLLDFGTITTTANTNFTIFSESGNNINAALSTSDSAISVNPTKFNSPFQEVKVKLDKPINGEIFISTGNGKAYKVSVISKSGLDQDFVILGPQVFITSEKIEIPITIVPQNNFTGSVSFESKVIPKNTNMSFEPSIISFPEQNKVLIKIIPTGKYLSAGIYPITVRIQGNGGKQSHDFNCLLLYQDTQILVPHTVLGELFTAIWCLNCVYSHRAMDRLIKEYGREKVNWIEYYVDSIPDQATVRLSNVESEQRMKWYMSDKGIPDIFFDGSDHLKGVPTSGDTSPEANEKNMYEGYKKKLDEFLNQPSIVSIQANSYLDSSTNLGHCSAIVTALETIPFKDPRLYFALIESNIPYSAINGDKVHFFVLRDFLTPVNDDLHDYLGSPIKLSKKGDIATISVDYKIKDFYNVNNLNLVVFVQDNITKKVMQSLELDVKTIGENNFELVGKNLNVKRSPGEIVKIMFSLINTGTLLDSYSLSYGASKEKIDFTTLLPGEKKDFSLDYQIPKDAVIGSSINFQIEAKSANKSIIKTIPVTIDIISSRPPDFKIETSKTKIEVKAGETNVIDIKITPDSSFYKPILLSISDPPKELESVEFSINNQVPPFESKFSFRFDKKTSDKEFKIQIQAKGESIVKTQDINIFVIHNPDFVAPQLFISYPEDNSLTNKKDLTIIGTTDGIFLSINEKEVPLESNGTFSFNTSLKEGKNVFIITAKNKANLETSKTISVILDSIPPQFTLDVVSSNVYSDHLTIKGQVELGVFIGYVINQDTYNIPDSLISFNPDEKGFFSFTVKLIKGWNTINIAALDKAGNISNQNIETYYATKITLQIGNRIVTVNNKESILEAPPYIKNKRTMVPIRLISESIDAKVDFNATNREITIVYIDMSIRLKINSNVAWIKTEGKIGEDKLIIEAPPEIVSGRTFVPLRFISELFGFATLWDSKTLTITLDNAKTT